MGSADDRRFEVLRAIVADFVATKEPIGSKSLVDRHNLGVSSATIRNDMAVLEAEGEAETKHAGLNAEAGWYLAGYSAGLKVRKAALQAEIVPAQVAAVGEQRRCCPSCGRRLASRGHYQLPDRARLVARGHSLRARAAYDARSQRE